MFRKTHTITRSAAGLAVAAFLAGLTASSGLASGNTSFTREYATWLAGPKVQHLSDGRSPDTRDAAQQARFGREYAAWLAGPKAHLVDGRSPDTRDAALQAQQATLVPLDGRSPDTHDAAFVAHEPVVTLAQSPGFQWGDFAIGIGAALGLMLVLGLTIRLLAARHGRKQPGPVATA
jgi:hypothetical protein